MRSKHLQLEREILKSRKKAEKYWLLLISRYRIVVFWFVTLNICSFFLTALLIFLNIYAIKLNADNNTKLLFVIIAVFSATIAALNALRVFFASKKQINLNRRKIKAVRTEMYSYQKKAEKYASAKNPKELILNNVLAILYET